jgi:hypothetical protein
LAIKFTVEEAVDVTVYVVFCVGLTTGLAMLGVVKLGSTGLEVHVYPVAPPLAESVVEPPEHNAAGGLRVKPEGLVITILGCDTTDPVLSVTETV